MTCLVTSLGLSAREVDTPEEEVRIQGFPEQREFNEAAEKNRLSDLEAHKKKNAEWEDLKNASLKELQLQKKLQANTVDDSGPDYHDYLLEKERASARLEGIRKKFIQEKLETRARNKRKVQLSEEEELAIYEKSARVDWKKRKFIAKPSGNSGTTTSRPQFGGSEFAPPPPSNENSPGYFESMPPPPPPPIPYEPSFDSEFPPPPPPPMFDDEGGF